MATLQEVRRELDKDELDYEALAIAYGKKILPQLKSIVAEDQPRLASKAAYLAGLIAGETSHDVVALAARSRHNVVRVSAAAATASLSAQHAADIATTLLQNSDRGVRATAARSAGKIENAALRARLQDMATQDTDPQIRSLAASLASAPRADRKAAAAGAREKTQDDMTKGAAEGRMPGVEPAENGAMGKTPRTETTGTGGSRSTPGDDMTKGAAEGRMPGVEPISHDNGTMGHGQVAGHGGVRDTRGDDMTKGAAEGRMPGVEPAGSGDGKMRGNGMNQGSTTGGMPGMGRGMG